MRIKVPFLHCLIDFERCKLDEWSVRAHLNCTSRLRVAMIQREMRSKRRISLNISQLLPHIIHSNPRLHKDMYTFAMI